MQYNTIQYIQYIHKIYNKYAIQYNTYIKPTTNMQQICNKYIQYIHKIYNKYAIQYNTYNTYIKYTTNMQYNTIHTIHK